MMSNDWKVMTLGCRMCICLYSCVLLSNSICLKKLFVSLIPVVSLVLLNVSGCAVLVYFGKFLYMQVS